MSAQELVERFESVYARLERATQRSARARGAVQLVAVSKLHGADAVAALAAHWAGLSGRGAPVFGESYAQEAAAKRPEVQRLAPGLALDWHFIGRLQSNKAKEVAGQFSLIHSVDSLKLASALQKAWVTRIASVPVGLHEAAPAPQAILVQVNIGKESQKVGVLPEDLEALLLSLAAMPELSVQGLMCLPPDLDNAEDVRPYFQALRTLRDTVSLRTGLALPHLSMGMSHDFEQAVQEGATLVRIGTDIFGSRG